MNIVKRIFTVISVIAVLLLAFAVFALKSGFFTVDARDYVISFIHKNTGKDIRIGSIELGLINNIVVHDVSFPVARTFSEKGEFVLAKSITIRFNILDIITGMKDFNRTLSRIIIDSPIINLRRENGVFNLGEFISSFTLPAAGGSAGAPIALPVNKIFIQNGKIIYEDRDNTFNSYVENLSGTIFLKSDPLLLRVTLSGQTKDSTAKNMFVDVDYYINSSRFRGNLRVKDAPLKDWGAYLMQPKDFTINSGGLSVDGSVSGTEFKPEAMNIFGSMGLSNGDITVKGAIPVKEINTLVEINNGRVRIKNGEFRLYSGRGIINGTASDIFSKPQFSAKLDIAGINLYEADPRNLTGTARVRGSFSMIKDIFTSEFEASMPSGFIRDMEAKDIKIKGSLNNGAAKLTEVSGTIGDGSLTGSGGVNLKAKKDNYNIVIKAGGLDASKLSGAKGLSGEVAAGLTVTGPLNEPRASLKFSSPKLKYGGNDVENMEALISAGPKKISALAKMSYKKYKNLSAAAMIDITGGRAALDSFKLSNGKETLAEARGDIITPDKNTGVTITAKNIMLSDLAVDFLQGKEIDGAVSGSAYITGAAADPEIEASVSIPALKVRGIPYRLNTSFHFGGNVLKISEINFNDTLKGSGEFSLRKKVFEVNVGINNFSGDVLSEFSGMKIFDGGIMNGKMAVKKEAAGYGGSVNISTSFVKGSYRDALLDISGAGNSFTINSFDIKEKRGTLRASGNFAIKNDDTFSGVFAAKMRDFRVNDSLTASAELSDDFEFFLGGESASSSSSNVIKGKNIVFNSRPLEDAELELHTTGESVPDFKFKWGESYSAEGSLNAEAKVPFVEAQLLLHDADLFPFYAVLNSRDRGLPREAALQGEFSIKGPIDNASFSGSLTQEKGTIGWQGFAALEKKKSVYGLSSFMVKYNAANVDLKNFLNIFDASFKDTGRVNGSGQLRLAGKKIESDGSVVLSQGKAADFTYDNISADYVYADKKITMKKGLLSYKDSYLKLDGSTLEIKNDNNYYADITAQMKDFVWKGNRLGGTVNFKGAITNDKKMTVAGDVKSSDFTFKKHTFAPFDINVKYADDELKLQTAQARSSKPPVNLNADIVFLKDRVEFRQYYADNQAGVRLFSAEGALSTVKDADSNLLVSMKDYPPQMANDLLGWDHSWTGSGDGTVKFSGNTEKGIGLTIHVTLMNGTVDNVPFDIFSGLVQMKNDWVVLEPIMLSKTDKYAVNVSGKIPVPMNETAAEKMKGAEMDLHASVKGGDLSLIKFLKFVDDASGPLDAQLDIKGTKEFPSVSGKFSVTGGDIKLKYLFKELKNVYANILIKDNIIDIYTMRGDTERGTLKIENLDEKKGGVMKFMKPYEVNWKISSVGDMVRFTDTDYMEFLTGDADVKLEMTGLLESPNLKGSMNFKNARIVYPVKMKSASGEQTILKDDNNFAKKINWNVTVYGGENCRYYNNYYNNFADVTLQFDNDKPLIIQGMGNDMRINGILGIPKGTYRYMNTELSMDDTKTSKITFDGDKRPLLEVNATTTLYKFELNKASGGGIDLPGASDKSSATIAAMQKADTTDLTIYVRFYGRVGDIKLDVSSEPPLDRNRLLYIMTFGKDADKDISKDDALAYVDVLVNNIFKGGTEMIKGMVPIDYFSIKGTNLTSLAGPTAPVRPGDTTKTAAVEVGIGKNLGQKWYGEYTVKVNDPMNSAGQLAVEHSVNAEYSIDERSKFIITGSYGANMENSNIGTIATPGVDIGARYQVNFPMGSWNDKPTPTPTPKPKPTPTPTPDDSK
jgi:autotransporter translocation and assembly factor TamB